MFSYFGRLISRFRQENLAQLCASLAFTTLLSLVPFVAVALIVASASPYFATVVGHVDNFLIDNLMPGKAGGVVAKYMVMFSAKANQLSFAGGFFLVVISLMLMFSIEKAFNHLWRAHGLRPIYRRAGLYLVVVLLGPLVGGAIIGSMTYAVTASLGFFNEPLWLRQIIFKALALVFTCAFFSFLYFAVPNTRVRPVHAILGGIVAAAGIAGIQRLFELYVVSFATYRLLYGAFSALPIFLLWIYLCWVVVMLGALVASNFQNGGGRRPARAGVTRSNRRHE